MIDLILLRHAHAERDASSGRDQDRPLSALGRDQAARAAAWLKQHGAAPQRVLCSPAARTRGTLEAVVAAYGPLEVREEAEIYEAMPGDLINVIDRHREARSLLLIGHNPGLESLLALLTQGRSGDARGMPTGSVAWLRFAPEAPLEPGAAQLIEFWWP